MYSLIRGDKTFAFEAFSLMPFSTSAFITLILPAVWRIIVASTLLLNSMAIFTPAIFL